MSRWMAILAVVSVAGCIVSTQTGPVGETGPEGPEGKPGGTPWKDEETHIHYDDAMGVELARFSGEHPQSFIGNTHTVVLGGDATIHNQHVSVAFGSTEPNSTVYGGIGVKVDVPGSRMILGTSNDYATGVTNEAVTIDKDANVFITFSDKSLEKDANNPAFGSGQLHVSAISNGGDGFSLETRRTDNSKPTRMRGTAYGEIFLEVSADKFASPDYRTAIYVAPGGDVGVNNASPQYPLDVGGIVNAGEYYVNGEPLCTYCMTSDARLKKNITPLPDALARLLRLRGVTYEWVDPRKHGNEVGPRIGMIAQEVEQVFPEWVGTGKDGTKRLQIRGFEALAVESLREIVSRNDRLEKQVADLAGKLDAERAARERLEARLAAIESAVARTMAARR